jgi:hypothetical protein
LPGASDVPVAIVAISANSWSATPIAAPSAATPRTCRTAVPRVRWRKPMSARPRTITSSVQRPTLPRVAISRLFLKGTRVFDDLFSMLVPYG